MCRLDREMARAAQESREDFDRKSSVHTVRRAARSGIGLSPTRVATTSESAYPDGNENGEELINSADPWIGVEFLSTMKRTGPS